MNKCKTFIAYNSAVCLYKLGMLQEALKMTENAIGAADRIVNVWAKRLRLCILVSMGVTKQIVEKEDSLDGKMNYLQKALLIGSMNKGEIAAWMDKCRKEGTQLHIGNWYNLALACKNKSLFQESVTILKQLLLIRPQIDEHLTNKCYVLLAEAFSSQNCN